MKWLQCFSCLSFCSSVSVYLIHSIFIILIFALVGKEWTWFDIWIPWRRWKSTWGFGFWIQPFHKDNEMKSEINPTTSTNTIPSTFIQKKRMKDKCDASDLTISFNIFHFIVFMIESVPHGFSNGKPSNRIE